MHHDYIIISPCFNENKTVIEFLEKLNEVLATIEKNFLVIIVNDASTDNTIELLDKYRFSTANTRLQILNLEYNIGHQKAIYQGINYASHLDFDFAIIMDSDGEDDPEVIKELVQNKEADIIHVARKGRQEGLVFRIMYHFYKLLFYIFTGKKINFGNYSLLSKKLIDSIAKTSFIHFPAFILKLKVPNRKLIYADRNKRYSGKSKMKISSLINHAFKSFVEFSENVLLVFLRLFIFILLILVLLLGYIFYSKFIADTAVPGWASTFSAGLINMALLCFGFFVLGIMQLSFNSRNDYHSQKPIYKVD